MTKGSNSDLIKIWNLKFDNQMHVPAITIPNSELKDYRQFQNYFMQIINPVREKTLHLKLIDMVSQKEIV
jgi:hypothetical protein